MMGKMTSYRNVEPPREGEPDSFTLEPSYRSCPNLYKPWIINNELERLKMMRELKQCIQQNTPISVDTETTGLKIDRDKIIGMCISFPPWDTGIYCPMYNDPHGGIFWKKQSVFDELVEFFGELLTSSILKKMHNKHYDTPIIYHNWKIMTVNTICTMLMIHTLDPESELGLKENAVKLIHPEADWYEQEKDRYNFAVGGTADNPKLWLIPLTPVAQYGAADSAFTGIVEEKVRSKLEPQLLHLYETLVMPLSDELMDIRIYGCPLDKEYLEVGREWYAAELESIIKQIREMLKDPEFNPASNDQVREALFEKLKLPGGRIGKKGFSTDKDEMERLRGMHPVSDKILDYRSTAKMKETYFDGLLNDIGPDGSFRGDVKQFGTRTGRISASRIHQIPRGPEIRKAFVAGEGYVLVGGDHCLAPDQRILTKDLRWIPAKDIETGMEIVGFDEDRFDPYKISKVEKVQNIEKNTYKISTDKGEIVCSETHAFIKRPPKKKRSWIFAKNVVVGDLLAFYHKPWEEDKTYEGGWLAGFLDGEGWIGKNGRRDCKKRPAVLGFAQNKGPLLNLVLNAFEKRGFRCRLKKTKTYFSKKSGRFETTTSYIIYPHVAVLGSLRPKRLLPRAEELWNGTRTWNKNVNAAKVISIDCLGKQNVIAIQTSTRTFIVEGFLSHNSQLEARVLGHESQDPQLCGAFQRGEDVHSTTTKLMWSEEFADVPVEDIKKKYPERRNDGKSTNFALFYLETIAGLKRQVGCSWEEAKDLYERFHKSYSQILPWSQKLIEDVRKKGYVEMISGRKRYLPELQTKEAKYIILNKPPTYPPRKNRPTCYATPKYKSGIAKSLHFDLSIEIWEWTPDRADRLRPILRQVGMKRCSECSYLWECYYTLDHTRIKKENEHYERIVCNSKIQGCKWIESEVLTNKGLIPLKDLTNDYKLLTLEGETSNFFVHNTGNQEVFKIDTSCGDDFVTQEHHFFTYKNGSFRMIPLSQIQKGDRILASNRSAVEGDYQYGEEVGELLGILCGDGWYKNNRSFRIFFGHNFSYARKIYILIKRIFPEITIKIKKNINSKGKSWYFQIDNKKARDFLLRTGLGLDSKKTKKLPNWVFTSSLLERLAVLRGLYDTDGGLNPVPTFTNKSEFLVDGFIRLCRSIGIVVSKKKYGEVFKAKVSSNTAKIFTTIIQPRIKLKCYNGPSKSLLPKDLIKDIGESIFNSNRRKKLFPSKSKERSHIYRFMSGSGTSESCLNFLEKIEQTEEIKLYRRLSSMKWSKVYSITSIGVKPTMDIEMWGKEHSYIGQGLVQHNSAGDLTNCGIVRTGRMIREHNMKGGICPLMNYVHDEVIYRIRTDMNIDQFVKDYQRCMESPSEYLSVPLIFEPRIGKSWADIK